MRKGSILAFALVAAALSQTAGAITATKEYVDRRDTEIRTNAYTKAETDARITELSPRTSLEPATNYTDLATNALRKSLALITTNDVCNIVTNREVKYSFVAIDGTKYEITNYGFTETTATGLINGVAFALGINEEERFFYVENVPPHGYPVMGASADVGWPRTPDAWYNGVVVNNDYGHIYEFTKQGIDLGLARLTDIAPTVSNTVTKAYVESLGIDAGISADTATNIAQSALGDFSATGTVANATDSEYCNSAAFANYADVADA